MSLTYEKKWKKNDFASFNRASDRMRNKTVIIVKRTKERKEQGKNLKQ